MVNPNNNNRANSIYKKKMANSARNWEKIGGTKYKIHTQDKKKTK